jgi:Ca-activated chloride channel homolog
VTANYYEILEIPFDATSEEIRSAYRELARRLHPDTNSAPEAAEKFIDLQTAYETLIEPERRQIYDKTLPASTTTLPLAIHKLFSRSFIQKMDEPQILYTLIRIAPPGVELSGSGTPLNLCLVVDCSTSMQGALLDTVKATAIELVKQLREQDIISIVAFSDRAEVVIPAAPNQDPFLLQASIRMLRTSGGTEIYQGLEAGYREVQRYRSKKYANHMILITDGRTYGDEELCIRLSVQAAAQNIGISGLGFGAKWNDAFLDQLTAKTGGSSTYIHNPQDVNSFLKQKVNVLGQSYAEHLEYELELTDGVELRDAFRLQPDLSPIALGSPLRLGSVPRNSLLEFILDIMIEPRALKQDNLNLSLGRIYFDIPSQINPLATIRMDISHPVKQAQDPLPPPQAIVQAMSALTLYRIQERARQDVLEGRYTDATRRLQNLATHLLSRGEKELAHTVINEASRIQYQRSFSEDGDKQIKYGTRALLLPPGS